MLFILDDVVLNFLKKQNKDTLIKVIETLLIEYTEEKTDGYMAILKGIVRRG